MITDVFQYLEVRAKFVYVVHPHTNGKVELANRLILKGLKKKLEDTKGLWAELFHEILWSCHTIPHSTTRKTPFTMVYGADVILLIDIDMPLS